MKAVKHVIYVGREVDFGRSIGVSVSLKNIRWDVTKDEAGATQYRYAKGLGTATICKQFAKLLFPEMSKIGGAVEKYEITIRKVK